MRRMIAALLAVPMVFAVSSVFEASSVQAQSKLSAEQIIQQLTPTAAGLIGSSSRGLRMGAAVDNAGPPPRPAAVQPEPAMTAAAGRPVTTSHMSAPTVDPSVNLTVNFATGSVELVPDAMQTLDTLGQALSSEALSGFRFRVEGHTDTVGSKVANHVLSAKRAAAVVAYLTAKYGVPAGRLQAVGMGSDTLLVVTPDQTDEPRNRRVQIVNLGS